MTTLKNFFDGLDDVALEPAKQLLQSKPQTEHAGKVVTYDNLVDSISLLERGNYHVLDHDEVKFSIVRSLNARSHWATRRKQHYRVPGAWVQTWASRFSEFLASYSGIVEILKGVDQQFGAIAYGTLSAMLAIPVHKERYEREIEDALEELSRAFPRLEALSKLHERSDRLKGLIAKVYVEVVRFAEQCIHYFTKPSLGRVKYTTLNPPRISIQPKVAEIRKLLLETRKESEILMQQGIDRLIKYGEDQNRNIHQLRQKLSDMCEHQEETQRKEDQRMLMSFKSAVKIEQPTPHTDTKRYKKLLDEAFADALMLNQQTTLMPLSTFQAEPCVKRWLAPRTSSVLHLSGDNWSSIHFTTLNWLSYASLSLVELAQSDGGILAVYYCQVTGASCARHRRCLRDMTLSWFCQIVEREPHLLRSGYLDYAKAFDEDLWKLDPGDALEAAGKTFTEALSRIDPRTRLTLVLDRADQCCFARGAEPLPRELDELLAWLIRLVDHAPCELKILVVTPSTRKRENTIARRKRAPDIARGALVEKLDWHQEELG